MPTLFTIFGFLVINVAKIVIKCQLFIFFVLKIVAQWLINKIDSFFFQTTAYIPYIR